MASLFLIASWLQNVAQLIMIIVIFLMILAATYYTTRFIGKSGMVQMQSKNIKVFETFKIAPNKYIQIIKLGDKYYAIGVSKENISFLAELSQEQLSIEEEAADKPVAFKELFEKMSAKIPLKKLSKASPETSSKKESEVESESELETDTESESEKPTQTINNDN
ncbi:MAG: flagellar biosynthetic protein FliO [Lachnoclostridium sp.]|jgi:flagellar protein FliO/FliZ|nr:flagellar biosynthetic protein FliO [Lachnoclostridium sp.]